MSARFAELGVSDPRVEVELCEGLERRVGGKLQIVVDRSGTGQARLVGRGPTG